MAKGNPNPSKVGQFKKGQSGNPSGRSTEEQLASIKASEIAAQLRLAALSSLQDKVKGGKLSDADLELLLHAGTLKLMKDSEDRAHGTPRQAVDHTTNGKDMPSAPSIDEALVSSLADKLTGK